jgi:hypothetical protein
VVSNVELLFAFETLCVWDDIVFMQEIGLDNGFFDEFGVVTSAARF